MQVAELAQQRKRQVAADISNSRINLFYASHQLFQLAGARLSRYPSGSKIRVLKPNISMSL